MEGAHHERHDGLIIKRVLDPYNCSSVDEFEQSLLQMKKEKRKLLVLELLSNDSQKTTAHRYLAELREKTRTKLPVTSSIIENFHKEITSLFRALDQNFDEIISNETLLNTFQARLKLITQKQEKYTTEITSLEDRLSIVASQYSDLNTSMKFDFAKIEEQTRSSKRLIEQIDSIAKSMHDNTDLNKEITSHLTTLYNAQHSILVLQESTKIRPDNLILQLPKLEVVKVLLTKIDIVIEEAKHTIETRFKVTSNELQKNYSKLCSTRDDVKKAVNELETIKKELLDINKDEEDKSKAIAELFVNGGIKNPSGTGFIISDTLTSSEQEKLQKILLEKEEEMRIYNELKSAPTALTGIEEPGEIHKEGQLEATTINAVPHPSTIDEMNTDSEASDTNTTEDDFSLAIQHFITTEEPFADIDIENASTINEDWWKENFSDVGGDEPEASWQSAYSAEQIQALKELLGDEFDAQELGLSEFPHLLGNENTENTEYSTKVVEDFEASSKEEPDMISNEVTITEPSEENSGTTGDNKEEDQALDYLDRFLAMYKSPELKQAFKEAGIADEKDTQPKPKRKKEYSAEQIEALKEMLGDEFDAEELGLSEQETTPTEYDHTVNIETEEKKIIEDTTEKGAVLNEEEITSTEEAQEGKKKIGWIKTHTRNAMKYVKTGLLTALTGGVVFAAAQVPGHITSDTTQKNDNYLAQRNEFKSLTPILEPFTVKEKQVSNSHHEVEQTNAPTPVSNVHKPSTDTNTLDTDSVKRIEKTKVLSLEKEKKEIVTSPVPKQKKKPSFFKRMKDKLKNTKPANNVPQQLDTEKKAHTPDIPVLSKTFQDAFDFKEHITAKDLPTPKTFANAIGSSQKATYYLSVIQNELHEFEKYITTLTEQDESIQERKELLETALEYIQIAHGELTNQERYQEQLGLLNTFESLYHQEKLTLSWVREHYKDIIHTLETSSDKNIGNYIHLSEKNKFILGKLYSYIAYDTQNDTLTPEMRSNAQQKAYTCLHSISNTSTALPRSMLLDAQMTAQRLSA